MSKVSPTQRTLKHMRGLGYTCQVVEHWNPFAKIRQDLFGFIDVLCLGNDEVVGVQSTSWGNVATRIRKIADHDNVAAVRKSGIRIIVHGWDGSKLREVDCS